MNTNDYKRLVVSGSLQNGLKLNTHRRVINWPLVVIVLMVALVIVGHFFGG